MEYETITKSIMVKPVGKPIFSEMATEIYLDDEAAGLFVVVVQRPEDGEQIIRLCKEEWPSIREAVDKLMERC